MKKSIQKLTKSTVSLHQLTCSTQSIDRVLKKVFMNEKLRKSADSCISKASEIKPTFWIIQLIANTIGAALANLLSLQIHFSSANIAFLITLLLLVTLIGQLSVRRDASWMYWATVTLMSSIASLLVEASKASSSGGAGWQMVDSCVIVLVSIVATIAYATLSEVGSALSGD